MRRVARGDVVGGTARWWRAWLVVLVGSAWAWGWPGSTWWRIRGRELLENAGGGGGEPGVEVFEHVRLDRSEGWVEFDGEVPINARAVDGSVVFLEVIACRRDTKEHESLVVTEARASHVHAGLLLLGAEPGRPGGWKWEGGALVAVPPEGPGVRVWIGWRESGKLVWRDALELIVSRADGRTFATFMEEGGAESETGVARHVFAGSRFVERGGVEVYDADGAGVVVGLHTFGSEVVGLERVLSHEASVVEPEWIARGEALPARGTPVVVRLVVEGVGAAKGGGEY